VNNPFRNAPCIGHADAFFPPHGGNYDAAKAICATCPPSIFEACREAGRHEEFGMWAGTRPEDRNFGVGDGSGDRLCRGCGVRVTPGSSRNPRLYCEDPCRKRHNKRTAMARRASTAA
jgi:hypothetical protein